MVRIWIYHHDITIYQVYLFIARQNRPRVEERTREQNIIRVNQVT